MRAEIKNVHSPDIFNLEEHIATGAFAIHIQIIMGPRGQEGEESFDVQVCSPAFLEMSLGDEIINGRHMIIMNSFSYKKFYEFIQKTFLSFEGANWGELALKISRYGYWEFEDYKE